MLVGRVAARVRAGSDRVEASRPVIAQFSNLLDERLDHLDMDIEFDAPDADQRDEEAN